MCMARQGDGDAYVAAADADICDADEDVVGVEEFRNGFVLQLCVFGAVQNNRWVLHVLDGW
jgi:hypothetical protein